MIDEDGFKIEVTENPFNDNSFFVTVTKTMIYQQRMAFTKEHPLEYVAADVEVMKNMIKRSINNGIAPEK